ncbi:MAG: RNA-binding transcriptional accessory protein [Firmicutes bacterium]|nr:RNA-binding transcriptional accessory protein [Bacillota bacterium]
MTDYAKIIAKELGVQASYAENAIALLDEGNTVPFIARYRKEATGSMDDQLLRQLADRVDYLRGLDKRRSEISASIEEQGAMTDDLRKALNEAQTLAVLEDIYRPYKPKRKTRASVAKAKGLEPLAALLLVQDAKTDPAAEALRFVTDEVKSASDALAGARDIIAEMVSDSPELRALLRENYQKHALLKTLAAKEEDSVYRQYYDYSEPVGKAADHRVLAINRGEKEGFLKVAVEIDSEKAAGLVCGMFVRGTCPAAQQVEEAALDAYKRLIHPSMENEIRSALTDKASEGAIAVFGENLRQLLLQPPVKGKVVMAMDPGYRMGCKVAVVDPTGKVLDTNVIYPLPEFKRVEQAKTVTKKLIEKHGVQVLAIGNGTAGKETEIFAADVIRDYPGVVYASVNEAGASVYSASKLAAEEFPQFDVNLRSAVSIARRLQDPLAELVKIDPKAVGVGQYQHDMPQKRLSETLDGVVEDCVNSVGVDLNTASAQLLARVAGLSSSVAANVVSYRESNGEFRSRSQLLKVKGLGPKAFEQCAGFLRIPGAAEKLDETAVHPESYAAALDLLKLTGFDEDDIGSKGIETLPQRVKLLGWDKLCQKTGAGRPTLEDIMAELMKPGRDMRDSLPQTVLRSDVISIDDLTEGMELTGTVRNVTDFGAFVDIGVHQDGLVHISRISKKFIKHPKEVLKVGMVIKVKILGVDKQKKRISLTAQNCGNPF